MTMNHDRTRIQVDKSIPPWEQPGFYRMDCEPHRSALLLCLSLPTFIPCLPAFLFLYTVLFIYVNRRGDFPPELYGDKYPLPEAGFPGFLILILSLIGIVLALPALRLARHDLTKMRAALMDPRGKPLTHRAWLLAKLGIVFNCFFAICGGALLIDAIVFYH